MKIFFIVPARDRRNVEEKIMELEGMRCHTLLSAAKR